SVRRSLLSHGLDVPEGYRTAVPNQIRLTNKKLTLSSKLSIQGAGEKGNTPNTPFPYQARYAPHLL
ncbi:MAG: hypothetical protein PHU06_13615, partial [Gallionella sp.]|nr:hypothetical protein [Gallionella sp.]MDD4959944.1 hypothetical protein [Gallionella sp.]